MILNLQDFVRQEQPVWRELEGMLDRLDRDADTRFTFEQLRRLQYLYQRSAADLAKLATFASSPSLVAHLEALVARAFGEQHSTRDTPRRFRPGHWLTYTLPVTFRRHAHAFALSCAFTLLGAAFGAGALALDPDAKAVLIPFEHLHGDPRERVAREEKAATQDIRGHEASFSGYLMTHNIRVALFTLALGMTFGFGTIVMLFYNGVILGAVAFDYVRDGQTSFLVGWLLPHGSVEIPAILLAGQAGFVLAHALLGSRQSLNLAARLRAVRPDLVTLIGGISLLLVWAGLIEAFLSQYHEPVVPYAAKIGFGVIQLVALAGYLALAGRQAPASLPPMIGFTQGETVRIQTAQGVVFSMSIAGGVSRFLA